MNSRSHNSVEAIQWHNGQLLLIDQRYLPDKHTVVELDNVLDVANAIKNMVVRGAPAIGITAAYGVVIAARQRFTNCAQSWKTDIDEDIEMLASSRPTAVNLFWALKKMKAVIQSIDSDPQNSLLEEAQRIHRQDIENNYAMGKSGAALIAPQSTIITHCNTGSLATGGFGTALGVIRQAYSENKINRVYADETRPWLQGTRLTAWELQQDNIPVSLIVDSAAATLMKTGAVNWVIVGSDRIAANGDVANKIGTYSLAVLARHHGVKFMVVAPTSTIDMHTADGGGITIEDRSASEVLSCGGHEFYSEQGDYAGVSAWNPAFDITPNSLIDAIVTEKGVVEKPDLKNMQILMSK